MRIKQEVVYLYSIEAVSNGAARVQSLPPPTPRSKSIAALMKNPPFFLFFAFVMSVEIVDEVQDLERDDGDIQPRGSIIWNYFKIDGVQSKKGGAKNVTCIFCDHVLIGCSSSRAFAHILGRPVLDQRKSNLKACIPIRRDDDDRYAKFKNAQKDVNKEMMSKEAQLSSSKAKQAVLKELVCPWAHSLGSAQQACARYD